MDKLRISRREFMQASAATVGAGLLPEVVHASTAPLADRPLPRKPNLILFVPDSLRADALSCYGNPICRTPNFDRLASEGTRFSNCFVQFPVCGASRCSLLTGWPTSVRGHRSLSYFLRPDEPNLFRYLKRNGYGVYWYGKNDALAPQSVCESVTEWNYPPASRKIQSRFASKPPWPVGDPHYYSFLYKEGGDRRDTSDYQHLQSAIQFLDREHKEQPFCIFLALSSPHPPYSAPEGFHNLYDPATLPPLRPAGLPKKPKYYSGIRNTYNIEPLPESVFRKIHAVYLGKVSYTDWLLGQLMEAVERSHHAEDSAVFVLSDHGDYSGDYGLVEKWPSGLEDVLTHVPVIVRLPGGAKGHVSEDIIELFDVMATCMELAGVQAQHTHFARSLLPQCLGNAGDSERAAFAEAGYNIYEPQCFEVPKSPRSIYYPKVHLQLTQPGMVSRAAMVRTRNHKMILRPDGQSELYDYRKDPRELHNLYGDRSMATAQEDLQSRLLQWYLLTTGIAPLDKDQRSLPPFSPTPTFSTRNWRRRLLDGPDA